MRRSLLALALVACGSSQAPVAPAAPPVASSSQTAASPPAPPVDAPAGDASLAVPAIDAAAAAAPPAPGCPASFTTAVGACTTTLPGSCNYPEGSCRCAPPPSPRSCGGARRPDPPTKATSVTVWQCAATPPPFRSDGCPTAEPHDGSACKLEGKSCSYGDCCFMAYSCTAGLWKTTGGGCPP